MDENKNVEMEMQEGETKETKKERFIRLAEYRTNKACKGIAALKNLGNRGSYEYTDEQVDLMFSVLEQQIQDAKGAFVKTEKKNVAFSFGTLEQTE